MYVSDFVFFIPIYGREGLSARPVSSQDEIQLRIDPLHSELDDQITGLYSQVNRLKTVSPKFISSSIPFGICIGKKLLLFVLNLPKINYSRG